PDPLFRVGPGGEGSHAPPPALAAFQGAISQAVEFWRHQPTGLGNGPVSTCGRPPNSHNYGGPQQGMQDLDVAPTPNWGQPGDCNYFDDLPGPLGWAPGGFFNHNDANPLLRDHTGMILGFWAQDIDSNLSDSWVWYRPLSSGPEGSFLRMLD